MESRIYEAKIKSTAKHGLGSKFIIDVLKLAHNDKDVSAEEYKELRAKALNTNYWVAVERAIKQGAI